MEKTLLASGGYNSLVPGILFLVVGLAMNDRLKRYFNSFYQENKCTLYFSTFGLSVPLLFRGTLNLLRLYANEWIGKWTENPENSVSFYIIFSVFAEAIPIFL